MYTLLVALIGSVVGLILGIFVARRSAAEKPIQGGSAAHVFHYLGASASVAVLPTLLIGTFVYHLGFVRDVLLAVGLLVISAVCLLLYAIFESQVKPVRSN